MSDNIKVYPEILKVSLAYENGWTWQAAHKVVIQGLEFSFIVRGETNPVIVVSSLDGGVGITTISYNPLLLFLGCDKQGMLKMLEEKAELVSKIIDKNGKEHIENLIKEHKESYETKFGEIIKW